MREIKFRAWDKGKMTNNFIHKDAPVTFLNAKGELKCSVELLQYTGIHDSNGVEIYEGDIVLMDIWGGVKQEVVEDMVQFLQDYGFWNGELGWEITKVIGNIHENPELLIKEEL